MAAYERITCEDVQVGDRIARSRNDAFLLVDRIEEGRIARRLHFAREACTEPEPKTYSAGPSYPSYSYCPGCFRRYGGDAPGGRQIAIVGHGHIGGGNIRPRRTAKLWREPGEGGRS